MWLSNVTHCPCKHTQSDIIPPVFLLLISVERHTLLFPGCLRQGNPSTSNEYGPKSKKKNPKWQHFSNEYISRDQCESERTARHIKRQWRTARSFSMSFSTVSLCSSLWISSWRSSRTFSRLWVLHRKEAVRQWSDVKTDKKKHESN